MLALQIEDVKEFMNQMLVGTMFDHFLLSEAVVNSRIQYTIDGTLDLSFFSEEEKISFIEEGISKIPFSYVKKMVFDMMKGTQTPISMKLVFQLSGKNLVSTLQSFGTHTNPDDISGMFINVSYQQDRLLITTGVGYSIFMKEKPLEHSWDLLVKKFLSKQKIAYLEL